MAESKSIFDQELDEAEEARLDAEADAAIDAGQLVTHDRVVEWLKSWGTPNELPFTTKRTYGFKC
jgi:predicted transcriptional regulator